MGSLHRGWGGGSAERGYEGAVNNYLLNTFYNIFSTFGDSLEQQFQISPNLCFFDINKMIDVNLKLFLLAYMYGDIHHN